MEHDKLADETNCCVRHFLGLVPDTTTTLCGTKFALTLSLIHI